MESIKNWRAWLSRPFILFTLILLVKGYIAWGPIFEDTPLWGPLLTEIPFLWILFCLFEWLATKRKLLWYMITNLLVTGLFFTAIIYFKYYGTLVNYHALDQTKQAVEVSDSVVSLLSPQYLLIFTDVIVLSVWFFVSKKARVWRANVAHSRMSRRALGSVLILSLALCVMNVWPNRASMNEVKQAEKMGILNYEAYTLLTDREEEPVPLDQITQAKIDGLKGIETPENPAYFGAAKGKNLIILQLESLQNFMVGLKVDGQEVTPNLNKLAAEGLYFPNFYQSAGQGNTSDAEFTVNTSFYIPPRRASVMAYGGKELPSLPKLLSENGYQTATFHTNKVTFWNRNELYAALGFDKYYDQDFFGTDDAVFFGPSDETLYAKTTDELQKMDESDQPFYAQIISMSSHHPFTIPESKYKMTLPERYEGTLVGDYIRAQNYSDYCLGLLIDELKEKGLWDDSVLMLYGDHLGLPIHSLSEEDLALMQEIYGHEYTYSDMPNIPFMILGKDIKQPEVMTQLGAQVDILPTAANLLGVSLENHIHFGQDLLNQQDNMVPERYYWPSGSMIAGDTLFVPGTEYADGTFYPLKKGGTSTSGVTEDQYNRMLELFNLSSSYVRQQPDRPESETAVEGEE
ncbi:LTA synthase family protein [Saccharibacillus sp. CPCC 101409]|uniref:LTA synthase family protein n=1 Tax=Saccharibacillus sp. CPCC 101409 TaxID=3058041 RepID=UPI002672769C|nr:LTA synthase family protein [Saccharibacillus sp. CPCC 101409]MDO3410107.1 LTA synthase family protein [Saccharibacillus sp. CPCC 101409]